MAIPTLKVKVKNTGSTTATFNVVFSTDTTQIYSTSVTISPSAIQEISYTYTPPTGDYYINSWNFYVYYSNNLLASKTVYPPTISLENHGGWCSCTYKKIIGWGFSIRLNFRDYYNLSYSKFYIGMSFQYGSKIVDIPPFEVNHYISSNVHYYKVVYPNGSSYQTSTGTSTPLLSVTFDDYSGLSFNGYTFDSSLTWSNICSRLGLTSSGYITLYLATWHGYDGTYMRGLFYRDTRNIYVQPSGSYCTC